MWFQSILVASVVVTAISAVPLLAQAKASPAPLRESRPLGLPAAGQVESGRAGDLLARSRGAAIEARRIEAAPLVVERSASTPRSASGIVVRRDEPAAPRSAVASRGITVSRATPGAVSRQPATGSVSGSALSFSPAAPSRAEAASPAAGTPRAPAGIVVGRGSQATVGPGAVPGRDLRAGLSQPRQASRHTFPTIHDPISVPYEHRFDTMGYRQQLIARSSGHHVHERHVRHHHHFHRHPRTVIVSRPVHVVTPVFHCPPPVVYVPPVYCPPVYCPPVVYVPARTGFSFTIHGRF